MELGSPIILVSAFGRGHWLASALAQEGIKTTLIDVSSKLGVWPVEDIEGPFGFYRTDKISESHVDCLYSENPFEEVPNGFTLWLQEGPVEFKGPLTKFKIDSMPLAPVVKDVLFSSAQDKNSKPLYNHLSEMNFDQTWLLHFAHQWASTTYIPSARAAEAGLRLPLLSSFHIRRSSRIGLEKSLDWLRSKGVEVIQPQQIVDVSFGTKKNVTGFEISGIKQGLFPLEQLVWTLTSEETYFLNKRLGKYFYPEAALESEWCWVRYRVGMKDCFERKSLPIHSVIVGDLYSPWSHENLMVLQRTPLQDQFDAWIRIPTVQRFNKEYLSNRSEKMKKHLSQRISLADPQILIFPQEYYYTYAQLGAPRHPIYAEKDKLKRGKARFKNMHLSSPEDWPHYAWSAVFERSEHIRLHLVKWWQDKLVKELKEKRKEQHP